MLSSGAPVSARPSAVPELPPVIGHRGAAARAPENTLSSFRRAQELGCTWIEFDARLTADGVAVVFHDPRLDRTTDHTGLVSALTLAAVREADAGVRFGPAFAGERVPTLDETLELAAEIGLATNIEIKAERGRHYATAAAVAQTLRRFGDRLPGVLVSSFDLSAVAAMRKLAPGVARGALFRLIPRHWAELAARLGCTVIGADHRRLRPRRIAEIRAAGYQLAAYTVNNPARARLLFGWGVTSVFSDAPDIISVSGVGRRSARLPNIALSPAPAMRQGMV